MRHTGMFCEECGKEIPYNTTHVCLDGKKGAGLFDYYIPKKLRSKPAWKSKWYRLRLKVPKKSGWYIIQTPQKEVKPVYFHQCRGWDTGLEISLWRKLPKPSEE